MLTAYRFNILNKFFIRDAQEILQRQADVLAAQASLQENTAALNQWINLSAQQGRLQVVIFDSRNKIQMQAQGISQVKVTIPTYLIDQMVGERHCLESLCCVRDARLVHGDKHRSYMTPKL